MRVTKRHLVWGAILLLCLLSAMVGWMARNPMPVIAAWMGVGCLAWQAARHHQEHKKPAS